MQSGGGRRLPLDRAVCLLLLEVRRLLQLLLLLLGEVQAVAALLQMACLQRGGKAPGSGCRRARLLCRSKRLQCGGKAPDPDWFWLLLQVQAGATVLQMQAGAAGLQL